MRPLFVGGCQRSGTTAFADYLNEHEAILITRERYKYLDIGAVNPRMFAFDRILDYSGRETNAPREYHERLLSGKDPAKLEWIGDKNPSYVRRMPTVLENNPGARFILLYRPVEEVAESFDYKARNPRDHWPEQNDFEAAIETWNKAQQRTRKFVRSHPEVGVLVIDYHDFFGDSVSTVPLLSSFLELEFDDRVRDAWARMSAAFQERRREKAPLSDEQAELIASAKDHGADRWVREYIDAQRAHARDPLPNPDAPVDGVGLSRHDA